jgi:hypothetical protein
MTATPTFTAPFVSPAGEDVVFELTVDNGFGGKTPTIRGSSPKEGRRH